ncbi:peptidase-like protein [Deinococcus irradiatisoli]|uniref:Peptidase-like protein n=1 Tax=Deinococcus irradiatisoli TaxID=2202254 RepID=A0A2Z3JBC2_9DEIO|nr:Ig-like domain-containing protein [Deinococcus irradiatisoli]AWN22322.1 peptidase-like protein [Deinococcus irradiatisoli]
MKQRLLLAALAPSLLLSACTGKVSNPPPVSVADTTLPTISLSAAPASVSAGGSVTLTAAASDNVGVTSVKFYRGETLLATDTSAPYAYTQTTTAADVGTLSFKAVASDAAGNTASASASVTVKAVSVADTTKPSVTVTLTQLTGRSYRVSAEASDNVGVSKVEFYDNGALIATSSAAPYATTLTYPDTLMGQHVITARAYDAAGNTSESSASLTLSQEPLPEPPVVTPQLSVNPVTQPGTVTVNALAGSSVGIAQVEFLLDGQRVALLTELPYVAALPNFTSAQNGVHTVTVRVTDKRGQVSESSQKLIVAIDDSEPNDTVLTAKAVAIGSVLNGTVAGQARDVDYFKFSAVAGDQLKLSVKGSGFSGGTLDAYVTVLLPDGKTMLEQNDDGGSGLDAEIRFNVPASGTYYVAVTSFAVHDDPNASDNLPTNFYQLALTRR